MENNQLTNFLEQIAFDYDMEIEVVKRLYDNSIDDAEFYSKLESEINKQIEERTDGKN